MNKIVRIVFLRKERDPSSLNRLLSKKMVIFSNDNTRMNIFCDAFGKTSASYLDLFVQYLSSAMGLLSKGSYPFLYNAAQSALAASKDGVITVRDVISQLESNKGNTPIDIYRRIHERLNTLLYGALGKIFDCRRGVPGNDFLMSNNVFVLDIPIPSLYIFITAFLSQLIHIKRNNSALDHVTHVIILDDLGQLSAQGTTSSLEDFVPSVLEDLFMVYSRSLRINIITSSHSIAEFSLRMRANIRTHISFKVGDLSEVEIQKIMALNDTQALKLRTLDVGNALYYSLVKFPRTAVEVKCLPVNLPNISDNSSDDNYYQLKPEESSKPSESISPESGPASEQFYGETELVDLIKEQPFLVHREIAAALNIDPSLLSQRISKLSEYVEGVEVGSKFKAYRFTAKGIEQFGHQSKIGRGDFVHSFWLMRIKKHYEREGWSLTPEKSFNNNSVRVDLFAEKDGFRQAIEVDLHGTIEHFVQNISKVLPHVDSVLWCTTSKARASHVAHECKSKFNDSDFGRISFAILKTFI